MRKGRNKENANDTAVIGKTKASAKEQQPAASTIPKASSIPPMAKQVAKPVLDMVLSPVHRGKRRSSGFASAQINIDESFEFVADDDEVKDGDEEQQLENESKWGFELDSDDEDDNNRSLGNKVAAKKISVNKKSSSASARKGDISTVAATVSMKVTTSKAAKDAAKSVILSKEAIAESVDEEQKLRKEEKKGSAKIDKEKKGLGNSGKTQNIQKVEKVDKVEIIEKEGNDKLTKTRRANVIAVAKGINETSLTSKATKRKKTEQVANETTEKKKMADKTTSSSSSSSTISSTSFPRTKTSQEQLVSPTRTHAFIPSVISSPSISTCFSSSSSSNSSFSSTSSSAPAAPYDDHMPPSPIRTKQNGSVRKGNTSARKLNLLNPPSPSPSPSSSFSSTSTSSSSSSLSSLSSSLSSSSSSSASSSLPSDSSDSAIANMEARYPRRARSPVKRMVDAAPRTYRTYGNKKAAAAREADERRDAALEKTGMEYEDNATINDGPPEDEAKARRKKIKVQQEEAGIRKQEQQARNSKQYEDMKAFYEELDTETFEDCFEIA